MSHHIKGETKADKKPMGGKDMKDTAGNMGGKSSTGKTEKK